MNSTRGAMPTEHRARKRFGQNFLHDANIIQRIVNTINPAIGQHIVEIGPGQAALTTPLVKSGARVDAIELDRDLAAWLSSHFAADSNFRLHQSDILKFDLSTLSAEPRGLRIVGNLPYNISTPCIFHLLSYAPLIDDMLFMLQLEVVQRLAAVSGDPQYGRLGIMAQYHCQIDHLFDVPPGAFRPAPKVTSAIVRLRPLRERLHAANDEVLFQRVVRDAFSQRRKTLRNVLKPLMKETGATKLPVDLSLRPENLSLADYVGLSNAFYEARENNRE
jgi:16S rRNA (adenine1518-N6/adenine1519-N6)-dimethyltransferase